MRISLILLFGIFSISAHSQRYFEFHFPSISAGHPGHPGEEYVVKISDTTLFWKMDEDLLRPDGDKRWLISGFIRPEKEGFNKDWNWEFRDDTIMELEWGQLSGCDQLPSYIHDHLNDWMQNYYGWTCPWLSYVRQEVFPNSIIYEDSQNERTVTIYPNPMNDIANVELSGNGNKCIGIKLFSIDNSFLFDRQVCGGRKLVLYRSEFPSSGIFIFKLEYENSGIKFGKLIVN